MTIQYQINIPLPEIARSGGRPAKYPWAEMPVGASFFAAKPVQTISAAKSAAEKCTGHKFTCRTVTEGGVKGTRVWRTA